MNLSNEQEAIVLSDHDGILTPAFAGAGKSTTLDAFSRHRQKKQIINLCFNKSVQIAAEKRFPPNVTSKTSHAMAFPKFGSKYANAKKLVSDIRPNEILSVIPTNLSPVVRFSFAASVIQVVNNYVASPDDQIGVKHLQNIQPSRFYDIMDLLPVAMRLWSKMVDLDDPMGFTHDSYLKLWQLSRPRLDRYDYILLDEAQDTTPALIDVIARQPSRKVIVGDQHQSIYAFRGAVDAMKLFKHDIVLPITTSYRFGPKIALLANMIIQTFKQEPNLIKGFRPEDNISSVDKSKPYAVIAKTNIGLFDQAVDAVQNNLRIHYVGGIQGYSLDLILDTHSLKVGQNYNVKDPFLRVFNSFDEFSQYAEESEDVQSLNLIKICDNYGMRIPDLIQRIKAANVSQENPVQASSDIENVFNAQVFLTTTHKSKGLEFNQVILAEDFTNLVDGDNYAHPNDLSDTEVNLHYVAITRAKHTLQLNQQLKDFVYIFKKKRIQRQQQKQG